MPKTPHIQGRDVQIQIFNAGRIISGITITNFNESSDSEIRQRELLGQTRAQKQLLIHGYKGTFETDVDSKRYRELTKFLNDADKAGTPTYEFAIQCIDRYKDGTKAKYRYVRVTLKPPEKTTSARKDDIKTKWEWEAEDVVEL